MADIMFRDMELKPVVNTKTIKINDAIEVEVRDYLSVAEKAALLNFVIGASLDDETGCFSPLRVEVAFGIALCSFYSSIKFDDEDMKHIDLAYDVLDSTGIIDAICEAINPSELEFIQELVHDTVADVARYNSSAAGIVRTMATDADGMNSELNKILEQIKSDKGQEALKVIKDVVEKG